MAERRDGWKNVVTVAVSVCLVCSILVSTTAVVLRPRQQANVALDVQKNLLQAAGLYRPGDSRDAVRELMQTVEARVVDLDAADWAAGIDAATFDQRAAARGAVTGVDIDRGADLAQIRRRSRYATVYLVRDRGSLRQVILPVRGSGLYSMLYGFVALGPDLRTVAGLKFYEQGETAGLGAEVDNPRWLAQWRGKQAVDEYGTPVIEVVKGGIVPGDPHVDRKVDAISGATITSTSVQNMLTYWLGDDGFGPWLERLRRQAGGPS
jgi:Na+-transporting NADH:ubiquinone oxidoreductase subunit C